MEKYTISTHNGSSVSRQHNLRNRKITDKENHIRRDGRHETWIDINPRDAYRNLFGKSIELYNIRMLESGHPERQIDDYYKKIGRDKKKHTVYEMIVGVGRKDHHPPAWLSETILKEFTDTWSERNPNLYLIGAYYHADEEGSNHIHLDYIPVAHGFSRGPEIQTALVKALTQQGIEPGDTMKETAQIIWEKEQNLYLETLCRSHGIEIEHPHKDHAEHLDTQEYKQRCRIADLERQEDEMIDKVNDLIDTHNNLVTDNVLLQDENIEFAKDIVERSQAVDRGYLSR